MCSLCLGVDPVSLVTSPEPLGRGSLGGLIGRGREGREKRERGRKGGYSYCNIVNSCD